MIIRFWAFRLSIGALLLGAFEASIVAADQVPSWFKTDSAQALSQAWRGLSTQRSAIFLWPNAQVLGGQLVDKSGKPIANAPIEITYVTPIRGYFADLVTDRDGYFVVYGPYSLKVQEGRPRNDLFGDEIRLSAFPGFPPTATGRDFALQKKAFAACSARTIAHDGDWAYYVFTVDPKVSLDALEFDEFVKTRQVPGGARTRYQLKAREGSVDRRERRTYTIQVVSKEGLPIAGALVSFQAYDDFEGNNQVVETDTEGKCIVEEYRLKNPPFPTRFFVSVDAPGYGLGPVDAEFHEGVTTMIRLERPARISGRIMRSFGQPADYAEVGIEYVIPNRFGIDDWITSGPDGTFNYDRVMPGAAFRLSVSNPSRQSTPIPTVVSGEIRLKAGEHRIQDVVVPMASSLRGYILDEAGRPVTGKWRIWLTPDRGLPTSLDRGMNGLDDAMFVFPNLNQVPFRMKVSADGFQEHETETIRLEEGELKFIEVRLQATR